MTRPDPRAADGPVVIRGDDVDIEDIQAAIRARIARRAAAAVAVGDDDLDHARAARLEPLDAWNLPRAIWQAMWPPNLEPWNLDEDFPIRSHRAGIGRLLVPLKRLQRRLVELLARPVVVRQAEINRTLALLVRTLADESAHLRLRVDALEGRLGRVGAVVEELRGEAPPLVRFEDEEPG